MHIFIFKATSFRRLILVFSAASMATLSGCALSSHSSIEIPTSDSEETSSLISSPNSNVKFPQLFMGIKGGYQWGADETYDHSAPDGAILGVYGGLQLSPAWSWDIGYQYHADLNADVTAVDVKTWLIESALRYDWYLQERLSLYSRLGAAYWDMEKTRSKPEKLDATGFSALGEIGISYHVAPHLQLSAGYQYIDSIGKSNTGKYDSHGVLVSLAYTFKRFATPGSVQAVEEVDAVESTPPVKEISAFAIESIEGHFGSNSAKYCYDFTPQLSKTASILNTYPQARAIIVGHTDSIGSAAYNQSLSEQRAQAVADELIRLGVALEQVEWRGEGESYPIADNATEEGRVKNRRVEVIIPSFQLNE
ncbi:MAG: OmpA family protein [Enterovibrio sp.]